MRGFPRYLAALAVTTGASLVLLAVFNLAVDPYDALGIAVPGVNARKVAIDERPKFAKPYMVSRIRPGAVILGSSRPAHALRTDHPCWRDEDRPVFNLAVEGTTIFETLRFLEHAATSGRLTRAIVELDPNSFFSKTRVRDGFEDDVLLGPRRGAVSVGLAYAAALLSWDMTRASIRTLRGQQSDPVLVDSDGRRNEISFERAIAKAGGQRALFRKIEGVAYITPLLDEGMPDADDATARNVVEAFDTFRAMLDLGRYRGLDLRFYLSPVHARQLEVYQAVGATHAFENWKRRLVQALEDERLSSRSASAFPIWDFSTYNETTAERVPAIDDANGRMSGYWETTHYTTRIGDLVLAEVLGCVVSSAKSKTGVQLTIGTFQSELANFRRGAMGYRDADPEEVNEVRHAVAAAVRERGTDP